MEGDLVTQQTSRPSHPLLQGGAAIIWSFNSVWDVYNIDSSKRVAAANAHRSGLSSAAHRPLDDVAGKWSIGLSQGLLQSNETIDLEIIDSLIQKDYGIDGYYDSGSCHCNVRVWLCKGVSHPDQVLVLKLFTDVDERDLVGVDGARREAAAFERLESVQGLSIPYSYGFYRFDHPDWNGASLVGHVMEYIAGESAREFSNECWEEEQYNTIMHLQRTIFESIIHFHLLGVFHGDLANRNIIVMQGPDTDDTETRIRPVTPVFIDFEEAIVATRANVELIQSGIIDLENPVSLGARRDRRGVAGICMDDGFGDIDFSGVIETDPELEVLRPGLERLRMRAGQPLSPEVMELDTICSLEWKLPSPE